MKIEKHCELIRKEQLFNKDYGCKPFNFVPVGVGHQFTRPKHYTLNLGLGPPETFGLKITLRTIPLPPPLFFFKKKVGAYYASGDLILDVRVDDSSKRIPQANC